MDILEDLRLNHEYCPKEVILAAADEIERLRDALENIASGELGLNVCIRLAKKSCRQTPVYPTLAR